MKRRSVVPIAFVTGALVIAGCGSSSKSKAADTSGSSGSIDSSAVLRATAEPVHVLDPVTDIDACNTGPMSGIYDVLIRTNADGSLAPGLATSWKLVNPTTFEFKLRQGVTFQDGTPFNAQAVADSIKRGQTDPRSTLVGSLSVIKSVTVVDDHTLDLNLSSPRGGIVASIFAGYAGMIPSPKAVAAAGDNYGVKTGVGAGPFKVTSFTPDQTVSLATWPGFWDADNRHLAGVDFGIAGTGQGEQTIPSQIQSGALDVGAVKDDQLPSVKAMSGLQYKASLSPQYAEIFVNYGVAPFNNLKVRQALEYAVDRNALTKALTSGNGTPASQPLNKNAPGYDSSLDGLYPYNPAKAKQLLSEAGFSGGLHIKVGEITHSYYQTMAEALQSMLKASNIFIDLVPIDGAQINNVLYVTKSSSSAVTAYAGNTDSGQTLELKFSSSGNNNPSHVSTPGLDEALAVGAAETDPAKRAAAYQKAEKIIMDNALSIPLFFNSGVTLFGPKVQGITVGETTCHDGGYLIGSDSVSIAK
ncbi:MAG: peptide transporter [Mycobacterium sp.]|nr:peptide transporter [Mycobacterium sp.]